MSETYNRKAQFAQGLTRVFKYIVENMLPKYKSVKGLTLKMLYIKEVYADLINPANIAAINNNAIIVLDKIKKDILEYAVAAG